MHGLVSNKLDALTVCQSTNLGNSIGFKPMLTYTCRAYPGLEFVVANTLAKWKKLEPNGINFIAKVLARKQYQ